VSTGIQADWVWLDGQWVAWDDANLHLLTHSLHYGLGVFEGTRAYRQHDESTAIFRLDDHLSRLYRSAHIMAMDIPFEPEIVREATLTAVTRNQLDSCYIRHLAFIGEGVMGLHPQDNPVRLAIMAWPWGAYLGDDGIAHGIRCKISSYSRHHPNSMMTKAKATGNYINSILAKREVVADGYDEALMLDPHGFVAEGSGENLFIVHGDRVLTPPLTSALEGITRATVLEILAELSLPVETTNLTRDALYGAQEVFLTGTAAEITPVREIDNRRIGDGTPGAVTKQVQARYFAAVQGEDQAFGHYLTPVDFERI